MLISVQAVQGAIMLGNEVVCLLFLYPSCIATLLSSALGEDRGNKLAF
jgi:hypothetical protein